MSRDLLGQTRNIYAIGRNYVAHANELNNPVPQTPVIFAKSPGSLCQGNSLVFPRSLGSIHFELEILLRIGIDLPCGAFDDQNCVSHIGLGIDFTARDYQSRLKKEGLPWHLAKNFLNSCYVAKLKQGIHPRQQIRFQLWQNEVLRQDGNSELMIFEPLGLIRTINAQQPLLTGDLIFTGTPEGVGPVSEGDRLRVVSGALGIDQEITIRFQD